MEEFLEFHFQFVHSIIFVANGLLKILITAANIGIFNSFKSSVSFRIPNICLEFGLSDCLFACLSICTLTPVNTLGITFHFYKIPYKMLIV